MSMDTPAEREWGEWDSNPHGRLVLRFLRPMRLPVPPSPQQGYVVVCFILHALLENVKCNVQMARHASQAYAASTRTSAACGPLAVCSMLYSTNRFGSSAPTSAGSALR